MLRAGVKGSRGREDGLEMPSLQLVVVVGERVKYNASGANVDATNAPGRGGRLDSMPTSMYLQIMATVMVQSKTHT